MKACFSDLGLDPVTGWTLLMRTDRLSTRCRWIFLPPSRAGVLALMGLLTVIGQVAADDSFEREPINYLTAKPRDRVAQLQGRIDASGSPLKFDSRQGYLRSVLEQLQIPISSQMLVFSKTSFQQKLISPKTPRAIFFSDDVYVGYVDEGEMLEVSAIDPQMGAVFYTLSQAKATRPQFVRRTHECLQCHSSSLTESVPGQLARSVYPDAEGFPILSHGTFAIDHGSPLRQRWGGWYVTGFAGDQAHMGNRCATAETDPDRFATAGDLADLKGHFDASRYPTGHSDLVALMVLEHQGKMHNLITRANYEARLAQRDEDIISRMLERPANYESESTASRLKSAAEPLVRYMLFCGEAPLAAPVRGTSEFASDFVRSGPRDRQGRSLRDLDLSRRMFKYPCSYLVYSEAFAALPQPMLTRVYRRLWEVLSSQDQSQDFAHLTAADRRAILEILLETKQGLPDYWKSSQSRK